jgi:hypothetical protein
MEIQFIQQQIYEVRGMKVMLDYDLANLYGVQTKNLNLAVKRNIKRFPEDFMFELNKDEWDSLRLQIETSNQRGGNRYLPNAFTEQGLAMLSGILNSDKAIQVNIAIMRAFVLIRNFALTNKDLTQKLEKLESKYNKQFADVFEAINFLIQKDKKATIQTDRKKIGFKSELG